MGASGKSNEAVYQPFRGPLNIAGAAQDKHINDNEEHPHPKPPPEAGCTPAQRIDWYRCR